MSKTKNHYFCPLEQFTSQKPLLLSITSKFLITNKLVACSNGKEHHHDHLISKLESHQMLLAA